MLSRADIEHVKEIAARIEKESYIPDTTTKIGFMNGMRPNGAYRRKCKALRTCKGSWKTFRS